MASKFFCDGCDREIGGHGRLAHNRRRVSISDGETSKLAADYDLCNSCANRLDRDMAPTAWPRCSIERAA